MSVHVLPYFVLFTKVAEQSDFAVAETADR